MNFRSSPRTLLQLPIRFLGDKSAGRGQLVNLCTPGCAIESRTSLQQGAYVALEILVQEESQPVCISLAKVRWVREGRLGLEFLRYEGSAREQLEQLQNG
ncbi:MAG: PilZ domain-containing protein [Nitrospiraceae bacterium]